MTTPLIIQAAISGSAAVGDGDAVPVTVEENVEAAVGAWRAGAAMIHVHARDAAGVPTQDVSRFVPIVEGIRAAGCDAILNLSTGSAGGRSSGPERYDCLALRPEIASFDCGTMNFGERVFMNPPDFLRDMAQAFLDHDVAPELECFDSGHVWNALRLHKEGLLRAPLRFQFVLGVKGGAPGTIGQIAAMRELIPADSPWFVCGVGAAQLPCNLAAMIMGGHVRTGLEDNRLLRRGVAASSNAELVERIVQIADQLGRPIATADEARELLGLRSSALVTSSARV